MADFHTYANSFQSQPKPGLARIRSLMAAVGNPQDSLACLHVGGTNGKGSVTMFLDSILRYSGYRVGRFISPNLCSVRERIAVDDRWIPQEELEGLFQELEPLCMKVKEELGEQPTQFEIWTAAAFMWFRKCGCDYVVLEVGMGGEFDATNVILENVVSVLTKIDQDHTAYLGNTPEEIAKTKCGIIKENCRTNTVVSAPQSPSVRLVIEEEAAKKGNRVIFVDPPKPKRHYGIHEAVYFPGYGDIRVGLGGVHQIENAYIALTVAKLLGVDIFPAQCGITYAKHPARMELLSKDPILLYDGGHNPSGIKVLLESLDRYYPDRPRTYLVACMADKEIGESLQMMARPGDRFIFTEVADNPRSMKGEALLALAESLGIEGQVFPDLKTAIEETVMPYRVHVICGSLYLYGDLPKGMGSIEET